VVAELDPACSRANIVTRAFSRDSNGKYLAKLYFAETYEGNTPAARFSVNVLGHEFRF
jgi:hypothetical protein